MNLNDCWVGSRFSLCSVSYLQPAWAVPMFSLLSYLANFPLSLFLRKNMSNFWRVWALKCQVEGFYLGIGRKVRLMKIFVGVCWGFSLIHFRGVKCPCCWQLLILCLSRLRDTQFPAILTSSEPQTSQFMKDIFVRYVLFTKLDLKRWPNE